MSLADFESPVRTASLEDVARVAAFAASDHARGMTATALNISCGTMVD
ncbi:SDR family oxidoreductase [Amycolatopsis sp. BJA-103]|nr:SDR family oxidoreductase [Amycolatopsis sp. BJA-103]